jgi:peptidoglycan/LPS O-acetylase OafA/YrhL
MVQASVKTATVPREYRFGPRLTASLDAARACAAFYVVAHHVANAKGHSRGIFMFGQEAVLVFFLLSGFVIFANERERALRPFGFYLRRLRRIYPALIVAMTASTAVAIDNGALTRDFRWSELLGSLFALQDNTALKPGVIVGPYLGNDPLWSLSYELAFYAVFPFTLRLWTISKDGAVHLIGALSCASYVAYALAPNHWSLVGAYFLVWWGGAMAANAYLEGKRSFLAMKPAMGWLAALCAIAAATAVLSGEFKSFSYYPGLPLRHFLVALLMLALFFGPIGKSLSRLTPRLKDSAAFLASVSYGVYVLHYPLLIQSKRAGTTIGWLSMAALLLISSYFADRWLSRALPRAPVD